MHPVRHHPASGLTALLAAVAVAATAGGAAAQTAGANLYVGIEIGSSAVKLSTIEVYDADGKKKARTLTDDAYRKEKTTGMVTNVKVEPNGRRVFPPGSIENTADAVAGLHAEFAQKYKLNDNQFYLVASSGVAGAADNFDDLVAAVSAKLPNVPRLARISAAEEVRLTLLQIAQDEKVKNVDLNTCALIDIGSGNVKFGYVLPDDPKNGEWGVAAGDVNLGTKAFSEAVRALLAKEPPPAGKNPDQAFVAAAAAVRKDALTPKLTDAKQKAKEVHAKEKDKAKEVALNFAGRGTIFLTGGTPANLVTIRHPDMYNDKTVAVTRADVDAYSNQLATGTAPALDKKVDEGARRDYERLAKSFNDNQTVSGGQILHAVFDAFVPDDSGRSLTFVRNAQYFWIQQYVMEQRGYPYIVAGPAPESDEVKRLKEKVGELQAIIDQLKKDGQRPGVEALKPNLDGIGESLKGILNRMPTDPVRKADLDELRKAIEALKPPTPPVQRSEFEQVRQDVEKLKQAKKPDLPPIDPARGWANFYRGRELLEGGRYCEAAPFFVKAVAADDDEPTFWYAVALAEVAAGRDEEARGAARRVAEMAYRRVGVAGEVAGHFERIQGHTRAAIEGYVRHAHDRLLLEAR